MSKLANKNIAKTWLVLYRYRCLRFLTRWIENSNKITAKARAQRGKSEIASAKFILAPRAGPSTSLIRNHRKIIVYKYDTAKPDKTLATTRIVLISVKYRFGRIFNDPVLMAVIMSCLLLLFFISNPFSLTN